MVLPGEALLVYELTFIWPQCSRSDGLGRTFDVAPQPAMVRTSPVRGADRLISAGGTDQTRRRSFASATSAVPDCTTLPT